MSDGKEDLEVATKDTSSKPATNGTTISKKRTLSPSLEDFDHDNPLMNKQSKNGIITRHNDDGSKIPIQGQGKPDSEKNSTNETDDNKSVEEASAQKSEKTSKDYYFDSYSHYGIHEEMIKDHVRTETYRCAIMNNAHMFKDKIVLDVGCGTGILSMFAAQAGAKHVYGIDCSAIIDQAKKIVKKNGFENKITLIKGKAEEVELPFAENTSNQRQVDIIVSEWMGYFLLYESMLDTVIYARDKWLVPNGAILPDKAVLYMCAVEDGQYKHERIDWWNQVYGFDFSPIRDIAIKEPIVDIVDAKSVVTDAIPILNVDIMTCQKEDLAFQNHFSLTSRKNDYIHGFVGYFECAFTQLHKPIGFSTSPSSNYTHWKQTLFYLPDTFTICVGEKIEGDICCKPNENNNRDLDITLDIKVKGVHSTFEGKFDYNLR